MSSATQPELIQALIEFVAWCCSQKGNLAKTISGKLAAVQFFHRTNVQLELPTGAPLVNRALKGIERIHVQVGTPRRVRGPVSWETLLQGQHLIPSWGQGGRVLWLCLALSYLLMTRAEEMFASMAGEVHPVHCLCREDVTFMNAEQVALQPLYWHKATMVRVRFRGHKGDQGERGSHIVRVRDVAQGKRSAIDADGGAVAALVELMRCHLFLPESSALCTYRSSRNHGVGVWGYNQALKALRQIVRHTGGDPMHVGLHSLRIGGATTLAAGGEIPDRIVQREGRWKEGSGSFKLYTRNNLEDVELVSRKLVRRK